MTLKDFFKSFDLFADAPNAVEKMRELILRLAVQGHLSHRSDSDGQATELEESIAKHRDAFISKKGIGKQRELAPVSEDEFPFRLPKNWIWVRLGTLCRVQAGFAFASAAFVQGIAGVPIIRIRDIQNDRTQINYVGEYRDEFLIDPGDYLVGMDGNFTVAKWRGPRALLNQRVSRLQWYSEKLESSFFAIAAQHRLRELQGTKAYTTVDHLSSKQIENILVPLPPLAEQKRIVAKVDQLMALCDQLEAQQQERETRHTALVRAGLSRFAEAPIPSNLNLLFHKSYTIAPADLRKSILNVALQGKLVPQDMSDKVALHEQSFSPDSANHASPYTLPEQWRWTHLGRISVLINGDRSKNYPNKAEYVPSGVPWINTGHIEPDGTLSMETMHYITREKFNSLRSGKVQLNDLIYCLRGATFGKTAIIKQIEEGAVASSLVIIRLSNGVDPRFAYRVLTSPLGRQQIFRFDNGSAQPNLSAASVKKYWFPIPPLAEQRRIVAKVDELMALVDALEIQLTTSRTKAAQLMEAVVAELTAT